MNPPSRSTLPTFFPAQPTIMDNLELPIGLITVAKPPVGYNVSA